MQITLGRHRTPKVLNVPLPVGGAVNRRAGEADEGRVRQGRHQVVAQVAAGGAMGFIDQHVDVAAQVQIGGHVAELVDGRDDEAAIVAAEQLVQPGDAVGVLDVLHAERGQVLEQLVFQFVAVDQQQDGGLVGFGRFEEQFGRLEHGEGLAAALRVPDQAAPLAGSWARATTARPRAVWCCRRMYLCSSSSFSAKRM